MSPVHRLGMRASVPPPSPRTALAALPPAAGAARPRVEKAAPGTTIKVGGQRIPRLEKAPTAPTALSQKIIKVLIDASTTPLWRLAGLGDLRAPKPSGPDWRSKGYAADALRQPMVKAPSGAPASLGALTILRPGLGNIGFSAAQVFRTAQHSDRVVLAYTYQGTGEERTLRPATEIDGVPVPPELRGKVFVIGSPKHNFISYRQSSDVFLEQLEAMRKGKALLGVDPMKAGATVIGHSQGGLDATLTRERLEKAGLGGAIGRLVAVGSPFGGSAIADRLLGLAASASAGAVDLDDGWKAVGELDPDFARRDFPPSKQRLVDLSYSAAIGGIPRLVPRLGLPPFELQDEHNIRPLLRLAATTGDLSTLVGGPAALLRLLRNSHGGSDGLVTVASATYGQTSARLRMPYDHIGIIEDFHVIDRIVADVAAREGTGSAPAR